MGNGNDPHLRRAGDPNDHDAERDALRHELGMGAVRAPLPIDVERLLHGPQTAPPDPEAGAPALMDLIAHQKPPVEAHFTDGALEEHARHERQPDADESAD